MLDAVKRRGRVVLGDEHSGKIIKERLNSIGTWCMETEDGAGRTTDGVGRGQHNQGSLLPGQAHQLAPFDVDKQACPREEVHAQYRPIHLSDTEGMLH